MKRRWLALGICVAALVIAAAFALTDGRSEAPSTDAAPSYGGEASARTDSAFRRLLAAMSFKEAPRPASTLQSAAVPQYPAFIPADQLPWIARLQPDVGKFIEEKFSDHLIRAGMLWVAAAQLQQIELGSQSAEAAVAADYNLWDARRCVLALKGIDFGDRQNIDKNSEILHQSANEMRELLEVQIKTKEAFVLYTKHMSNVAGKTFSAPKESKCSRP